MRQYQRAPLPKQLAPWLFLGLGVGCAPALNHEPASAAAISPEPAPSASTKSAQEGAGGDEPGAEIGVALVDTPAEELMSVAQTVWRAKCPEEMALVQRLKGSYCIDRYEGSLERVVQGGQERWPGNRIIDGREAEFVAVSVAGRKPQGYISGAQAAQVCKNSGKRLCAIDEWVNACRGPEQRKYPYGNVRKAGVCNDRFKVLDKHPVPRLFKQHAPPDEDPVLMWHPRWMNDERLHLFDHTVEPAGSKAECTNDYGVFDMVGNLHEWVDDGEGTFMGGFFMDTFQNGEGCEYRTLGHPFDYHDYSTGFRCCSDASWEQVQEAPSGSARAAN